MVIVYCTPLADVIDYGSFNVGCLTYGIGNYSRSVLINIKIWLFAR